jgi:DNA-binding ferritin-like protein (Dps family)
MFNVDNLNEFVNKMFDNGIKSNSDVKVGLTNFRKYLMETSMCDNEYLEILDKIIECSEEILALKRKITNLDVVSFIEDSINKENMVATPKQKKVGTKKNRPVITSNSCMGSSTTSSRCGVSPSYSSYSDSCGGGSYTSRC